MENGVGLSPIFTCEGDVNLQHDATESVEGLVTPVWGTWS
jgi:hypothetical protein